MNAIGIERYSGNWERLSKKLRLSYSCFICGENDYNLKECHHIDGNKRNPEIKNIMVLCLECHKLVHQGLLSIPEKFKGYSISGYSVTVAPYASSIKDWFDSKQPLELLPDLNSKIAQDFRRRFIKGFVNITPCNLYVGVSNKFIFGVLGFVSPSGWMNSNAGDFDIQLRADTTPSECKYSVDLLLYVLRTKEVQRVLENKFCRKIETAYSMCFSQHHEINRYRKHAKLVKKIPIGNGYNLGYIFKLGTVPSVKAAKALWMQNHKIK